MKLPEIRHGGGPTSLGRYDISGPARVFSARSQALSEVQKAVGTVFQDIHERDLKLQETGHASRMMKTQEFVNRYVNENTTFSASTLRAVGADMSGFEEKSEYPDYEAITPYVTAVITKAHEESLKQVTNKRLREDLEMAFQLRLPKIQARALEEQNNRHKAVTLAQMNEQAELGRVAGDFGLMKEVYEEQARLRLITPEVARKKILNAKINIETDTYQQLLLSRSTDEIRRVESYLGSDSYQGSLDAGDRAMWQKRLADHRKSIGSEYRQLMNVRLQEMFKAHDYGLGEPIDPNMANIFTGTKREVVRKQIIASNEKRLMFQKHQLSSNAELAEDLRYAQERLMEGGAENIELNATRLQTLQTVARNRAQMLENDSVKYLIDRSPYHQQLYDDKEENRQEWIEASMAEQRRLGVKEEDLAVVTNAEASAIATQINTGTAQERGIQLSVMRQQWGDHTNDVVKQLAREGKISGIQKIAATIDRDDIRTDLLNAASIPAEELKKRNSIKEPETKDSDVDRLVWEQSADFMKSMPAVAGTTETMGAIEILGRYYQANDRTSTLAEGIEAARKNIVDTYYQFNKVNGWDHSDKPLRIPIGYDAAAVGQGVKVLQRLEGVEVEVAEIEGYEAALTQEAAKDAIWEDGYWQTSFDSRRAILHWGTGSPVLRPDGSRVAYTWDEIITASNAPRPPGTWEQFAR